MKHLIVMLIIATFCLSNKRKETSDKILIIEGIGFNSYQIEKTKIGEVIEDFGNEYEEIDNGYSIEIVYKDFGLSFFRYPSDSTIFAIDFYYPFRGITKSGVILGESSMLEVETRYNSLDWYIASPYVNWYSEHPGIEYAVKRDTTFPLYPLNEEVHKKKTISRIVVLDNYDDLD